MNSRAGLSAIFLFLACVAPCDDAPGRAHPRLGLTPDLLTSIAGLRQHGAPEWTRFADWIHAEKAGRGAYVQIGGEEVSALFGYVVTHDPALYGIAFKILAGRIWRNPAQPALGLRPFFGKCPEAVYCDDHDAAYQGGELISKVALLFDWGHDRLTQPQLKDLVVWMNAACEFNHSRSSWAHARFRNDGAAILLGEAAAAYATEGENAGAPKLKSWFREDWDETIEALRIMGRGGAMAEGNAYGEGTAGFIINAANYVSAATGEDLFAAHEWFRKRLAYDAFSVYPNPPTVPAQPPIEGAALGGDDMRSAWSWHSLMMRPNGLPLARRFAGTEEAGLWNWVFRQPSYDQGNDAWYELFFYSPRPKLRRPQMLSWFDPSMGYVYVRSDWSSMDATWIAFWAGPHLDIHQHLDQGAFTIFKRRDLAIKSGNYDYNPLTAHSLAYYTRTVSSNDLLIANPKEYFAGFVAFYGCDGNQNHTLFQIPGTQSQACIPNDGGQRTAFPRSMALMSLADFENNRADYETAHVAAFQDSGDSVSWIADITNAYANPRFSAPNTAPKVSQVWRRFTFLRHADVLLIADQVVSTDEHFKKSWLVHGVDRIEVAGVEHRVADGESTHTGVRKARLIVDDTHPSNQGQQSADMRTGYAELNLETLLPAQFTYRLTGGREPSAAPHQNDHFHRHLRDFWVDDPSQGVLREHFSANWPPNYPQEMTRSDLSPIFSGGYGRWRLAIEPGVPAKSDIFLNVLSPSLRKNGQSPKAEPFETQNSFGAILEAGGRRWKVEWAKNSLTLPSVE